MTDPIAQLEAIYNKSLDEMDEQELLTAIEAWHDDDNYLPIIALVDALPSYHLSWQLLYEKASAHLCLYHQTKDPSHLHQALDAYEQIRPMMNDTKRWHYEVGCAYFYLNDPINAQEHLSQSSDFADEFLLLAHIHHATDKHISTIEAQAGGKGGIEYVLSDFKLALEAYAPKILESLNPPASDDELDAFEKRLGIPLPENFRTLYRTFNGQKFGVLFSDGECLHRFLSLEEIEMVKHQYINKLITHYGTNWQNLTLPKQNVIFGDKIKNRLYHNAWLPIAMSEEDADNWDEMCLFCLDLDPNDEGVVGQPIGVYFDELPEYYQVLSGHDELQWWFYEIIERLQKRTLVYDEDARCLVSKGEDKHTPNTHFYEPDERTALECYIENTFGKIGDVFGEVISLDIECRIYVICPSDDAPFYTLITGGMGAYAMNTPDLETPTHAELMIRVPSDWDLKSNKEKDYWPIRWLKNLARQPLQQNSHLTSGHTLTTYTLADTDFEGLLLLEVDTDDNQIACVRLPNGNTVFFYQLVPLYREELQYKLDVGLMSLMKRLEEAGIPYPPVVDAHRPNVCADHQPKDSPLMVFDGVFWTFDGTVYEA